MTRVRTLWILGAHGVPLGLEGTLSSISWAASVRA